MSYSQQRLESRQLFDYSKLGQEITDKMATAFADTKHNQFLNHLNWDLMSETLTQEMRQFVGLEEQLNQSIETSIKTEKMIQQLITESENSDNNSLKTIKINELFDKNLSEIRDKSSTKVEDNENYKRLVEVLTEFSGQSDHQNEDDEELQTLESEMNTIPIDPFSKREIEIPVKNKKCGHLYDREQLRQVLAQRGANQRQKCPIVGCGNKSVTMNDVIEDRKTQILIQRLKKNHN